MIYSFQIGAPNCRKWQWRHCPKGVHVVQTDRHVWEWKLISSFHSADPPSSAPFLCIRLLFLLWDWGGLRVKLPAFNFPLINTVKLMTSDIFNVLVCLWNCVCICPPIDLWHHVGSLTHLAEFYWEDIYLHCDMPVWWTRSRCNVLLCELNIKWPRLSNEKGFIYVFSEFQYFTHLLFFFKCPFFSSLIHFHFHHLCTSVSFLD